MEQQEETEIKPYDVIVVGAGAAGMMAAGTAARKAPGYKRCSSKRWKSRAARFV